jgi:hypothetical protein
MAAIVAYNIPVSNWITTEPKAKDSQHCVVCLNTEKNHLMLFSNRECHYGFSI